MPIAKPKYIKIIIHLLFWILFTCVSLLVFSDYYWTKNPFLQYLLILVVIVYANDLVLLPFFIKKKWYVAYVLLFGVISFLATQLYCNVFTKCGCTILKCMSDYLWQTLVPLIFFSFIWMLFRNMEKQEELERIQQEHTAMELKFLKSQINPHVLLNNLNTIYSYSLEKPDEVPDLLLMLSDNLKHVLYDSNSTFITLEKELSFIDNYIAFQKIRTSGVKTIEFTKTINGLHYKIAPLLMITIIENAFKYSIANSVIKIDITVDQGKLKLMCKNEYNGVESTDLKNGIGLSNLKKRLQLIYPDKHRLSITKEQYFQVDLTIELND